MYLNNDLTLNSYFKLQIWNLALQPAYNICKVVILMYDVLTLDYKILSPDLHLL